MEKNKDLKDNEKIFKENTKINGHFAEEFIHLRNSVEDTMNFKATKHAILKNKCGQKH